MYTGILYVCLYMYVSEMSGWVSSLHIVVCTQDRRVED